MPSATCLADLHFSFLYDKTNFGFYFIELYLIHCLSFQNHADVSNKGQLQSRLYAVLHQAQVWLSFSLNDRLTVIRRPAAASGQ